jgi:glycosyltransferase EpsD
MSKKVLFTATVLSHIGQFHMPTFRTLKRRRYEIHVAAKNNLNVKSGLELKYVDKYYDIPFERMPLSFSNIKAYFKLKKIINKNDYDILHCNTPTAGILTRIAARKKKIRAKVIYTAHGFHFFSKAPIKFWAFYYPIERMMARITDALITINEEDYKRAKQFKLKKNGELHHLKGLGIDIKNFPRQTQESKTSEREKYGIRKNDYVIFSVGELNKNKHQDLVIKAVNELKRDLVNIKLIIAGNGPMEEKYKRLIKNLNIEDKVIFTGYTRDISALMQASDVFVSSSKREGLPISVLEAMATGLPMVVTDCRGNRDLVKNGINGLLTDVYDYKEMVKAIKRVYYNKDLSIKFYDESKKILKEYNSKRIMREIGAIYKMLVK